MKRLTLLVAVLGLVMTAGTAYGQYQYALLDGTWGPGEVVTIQVQDEATGDPEPIDPEAYFDLWMVDWEEYFDMLPYLADDDATAEDVTLPADANDLVELCVIIEDGGEEFCIESVDDIVIAAEPEPEGPTARIEGPHNVDPGAEVVLEVVTEGFDEGTETYLWDDDSTAATRDLGVVDGGDTGVYTCEVGGDVDGEALEEPLEASFTLWVGVATPLAGGLGLGLLAGACALAGVVSIRRKK